MSVVGRHQGWLLVYEIQYWLLLVVSVLALLLSMPLSLGSIVGILAVAAFWGIPILSLYRSTGAVRRGHIVWCWVLTVASASMIFTNPPDTADQATRLGEYFGSALVVALWLAWALYWQKSVRVKNSYPARDLVNELE